MVSPLKKIQQQTLAIMAASTALSSIAPEMDDSNPAAGEYQNLLVALHNDLREISDIASIEARNPIKAEKAKTYTAWIEGALIAGQSGHAVQDEIVVQNLIWALDYADYDYALILAAHVIDHGLNLPDRFKSTSAGFVCEKLAEASINTPESVTTDQLRQIAIYAERSDVFDQVKAKVHKALARDFIRAADAFDAGSDNAVAGGKPALTAAALDNFERAFKLDPKTGVKKEIETTKRALAALGGRERETADTENESDANSGDETDLDAQ